MCSFSLLIVCFKEQDSVSHDYTRNKFVLWRRECSKSGQWPGLGVKCTRYTAGLGFLPAVRWHPELLAILQEWTGPHGPRQESPLQDQGDRSDTATFVNHPGAGSGPEPWTFCIGLNAEDHTAPGTPLAAGSPSVSYFQMEKHTLTRSFCKKVFVN